MLSLLHGTAWGHDAVSACFVRYCRVLSFNPFFVAVLIGPRGLYHHAHRDLCRRVRRGHFLHVPRDPGYPFYPSIFPAPISSSSFSRLRGVSVGIQAIGDDDNPGAALAIHRELFSSLRDSTVLYNHGICTTALHKGATSSLDKTAHQPRCPVPCTHRFRGSQPLQAEH